MIDLLSATRGGAELQLIIVRFIQRIIKQLYARADVVSGQWHGLFRFVLCISLMSGRVLVLATLAAFPALDRVGQMTDGLSKKRRKMRSFSLFQLNYSGIGIGVQS